MEKGVGVKLQMCECNLVPIKHHVHTIFIQMINRMNSTCITIHVEGSPDIAINPNSYDSSLILAVKRNPMPRHNTI